MTIHNKVEKVGLLSRNNFNLRFNTASKTFTLVLACIICCTFYLITSIQLGKPIPIRKPTVTDANGISFRNASWKYDVGKWLHSFHETSPYITMHEKLYGKSCLNECNNNGVCNYESGECRCRMGYKGPGCSELEIYPCNLPPTPTHPSGPWIYSLCSASCDERTAKCRCGPDSKYPDRYVRDFCGFEGAPSYTGRVDNDVLYSKNESNIGWCNAEFVPGKRFDHLNHCICNQDGRLGRFCEIRNLAYCVNGCTGHGVCESGYCRCTNGWYGIDCSIPSIASFNSIPFPSWLSEKNDSKELNKDFEIFKIKRKRPLIYVYDLPGEFNFQILEGRTNKLVCVPWLYGYINETVYLETLFAMELAVHEGMLSSPHRTMDAELADYFFVPLFAGCVSLRFADSPKFGREPKYLGSRLYLASEYYLRAYEYIKSKHPYWNRNNGKDHLWVFSLDEGSCISPQDIWNGIMLTSFGNTMTRHPNSTTGYNPDVWNMIPYDVRGQHPCYDPAKDIVMPAFKDPNPKIVNLRLWEKDFNERKNLFYFNGNLGSNYTNGRYQAEYSMGIRQKVAYYFGSVPNIHNELGIKSQNNVTVKFERSPNYAEELASSRFCGAFPGDGFSARMEDAILSGCIPVIIQDGIHLAFENFLNFVEFTVRINEIDIPNMIQILEGISESRVKSMLQVIQGLWQRYTYHSTIKLEAKRQLDQFGHEHEWAKAYNQLQGDDALDTMFQILHYKLYNDPWRKAKRNISRSAMEQPIEQDSKI